MKQIFFEYPFMIFQKCDCKQQVPIQKAYVVRKDNTCILSWETYCTCCGNHIHRSYNVEEGIITDMTQDINAYKIIPSIKDEIAVVKLESFKAKIKNNEIFFFGNYSHLRFFDNVIEEDIIPIYFTDITQPYAKALKL